MESGGFLKSCIHPLAQNDSFLFQVQRDRAPSLGGSYSAHSCSSQISLMRQTQPSSACLPHPIKTLKAITLLSMSVVNV